MKSLCYKLHATTEFTSPGMSAKTENDQTVEILRQGEKALLRIDIKATTVQQIGAEKQKSESTTLMITDREYTYTYTDGMGQRNATRQKLDPAKAISPLDTMGRFKEMEKDFAMKRLPDETVNGKSCYVIETSPKDAASAMPTMRTRSYFDKATGVSVKSASYDSDGKVVFSSTTTDIKIDQPISPDRFKFKPPEGVPVEEITPEPAKP